MQLWHAPVYNGTTCCETLGVNHTSLFLKDTTSVMGTHFLGPQVTQFQYCQCIIMHTQQHMLSCLWWNSATCAHVTPQQTPQPCTCMHIRTFRMSRRRLFISLLLHLPYSRHTNLGVGIWPRGLVHLRTRDGLQVNCIDRDILRPSHSKVILKRHMLGHSEFLHVDLARRDCTPYG